MRVIQMRITGFHFATSVALRPRRSTLLFPHRITRWGRGAPASLAVRIYRAQVLLITRGLVPSGMDRDSSYNTL